MVLYEEDSSGTERVRLLEDMYQNSKTEVRCVVGVRDGFKHRHTL